MEKIKNWLNRVGEFAERIEALRFKNDFTSRLIYSLTCGLLIALVGTTVLIGFAGMVFCLVKGPIILAPVVGLVMVFIVTFLISFSNQIGFK